MCRLKADAHAISLGIVLASSRNKPVPIGLLEQPYTTAKHRKVSEIQKKHSGKKKQKNNILDCCHHYVFDKSIDYIDSITSK